MKTFEKIPCSACDSGHYEEIITRYEANAADEVKVVLPNVKLLRCSKCGDELIPAVTQAAIDKAVMEQTEQLSPRELEDMADRFGGDQTEISETLGLGSKTFHRWLNGTQYPSRSMGYYLRVLFEFPEALEWLRERRWRKSNRLAQPEIPDVARRFRDLEWLRKEDPGWFAHSQETLHEDGFNPASLFRKTKVK